MPCCAPQTPVSQLSASQAGARGCRDADAAGHGHVHQREGAGSSSRNAGSQVPVDGSQCNPSTCPSPTLNTQQHRLRPLHPGPTQATSETQHRLHGRCERAGWVGSAEGRAQLTPLSSVKAHFWGDVDSDLKVFQEEVSDETGFWRNR